jgi:hypothetical protein
VQPLNMTLAPWQEDRLATLPDLDGVSETTVRVLVSLMAWGALYDIETVRAAVTETEQEGERNVIRDRFFMLGRFVEMAASANPGREEAHEFDQPDFASIFAGIDTEAAPPDLGRLHAYTQAALLNALRAKGGPGGQQGRETPLAGRRLLDLARARGRHHPRKLASAPWTTARNLRPKW